MNTSIILPSYNPTEKLITVVTELAENGFEDIIIINDGSSSETLHIFDRLKTAPGCTVLHNEKNMGKGMALKNGFAYFLKNRPATLGVVTVDDDGQHDIEDILNTVKIMEQNNKAVLGVRDFTAKSIPLRSRFGNMMTSFVFRAFCGIKLSDTQTGLRAYPREYLKPLLETDGERYEYETNTLLMMNEKGLLFDEYFIKVIYVNNNEASHFNPIIDSVRIYGVILKFLFSSLLCSVIDLSLFTVFNFGFYFLPTEAVRVLVAVVAARIISSLVNFNLNRKKVFGSENPVGIAMVKYYILCVVQFLCSYFGVLGLTLLFGAQKSIQQTLLKMVIDVILFLISYKIQKKWVFGKSNKEGAHINDKI